jgi:hypothetical protein
VVICDCVQFGRPAKALAKSIARVPATVDGPAIKPASPIGAALDLLVTYDEDG